MTTGLFWKYTDEAYDNWVEEHVNWMTNNVPTQVSEAFENEIESYCLPFSSIKITKSFSLK